MKKDSHVYTSSPWTIEPYDPYQKTFKDSAAFKKLSRLQLNTNDNTFKCNRGTYISDSPDLLPIPGTPDVLRVIKSPVYIAEGTSASIHPAERIRFASLESIGGKESLKIPGSAEVYFETLDGDSATVAGGIYHLIKKDGEWQRAQDLKLVIEEGAKIHLPDEWTLQLSAE